MNHSEIIWHAPSVNPDDPANSDKVGKLEADQNNVYVRLGDTYLQETNNKFNFNIAHPMDMKVKGDILIHTPANNKTNIKTDDPNSMNFQVDKTNISMTSPENTHGFKWSVDPNYITNNIGDTYWRYDTLSTSATYKNLMLAGACNRLYITPNGHFQNKLGVKNTLYVGDTLPNASDITGTTYFNKTNLEIRNDTTGQITKLNDAGILVTNTNGGTANRTIAVGNQNNTQRVVMGFGTMTIQNNSANANITFTDGTANRDCHIYKPAGKDYLVINKGLKVDGDITTLNNGRVFNAVYNDYGEVFRKSPYSKESINPGDIVFFDFSGNVSKECQLGIKSFAGIVSDSAGFVLGGEGMKEEERVVIGLAGRVYVKTNRQFNPGDKVVAGKDGLAHKKRLIDFRPIIGIACELNENLNKVRVIIK